jgi:hypothetical protein
MGDEEVSLEGDDLGLDWDSTDEFLKSHPACKGRFAKARPAAQSG